jgi:ABC-type lipoprotein export system ATPase subunit
MSVMESARDAVAVDAPVALSLRDVHQGYERAGESIDVLRGADLEVRPGELVAVVGRSGSGKSTLLHVAGGLVTPEHGEVAVGGRTLHALRASERAALRRRTIGFVFQFFHLLPHLSVRDNVALPLLLDGGRTATARERADVVLAAVGLADRASHLPSELSGGQLQRSAIARALVSDPAVVLADEPTGNLDTSSGGDIMSIFTELWKSGRTLVIITHDPALARRASRIVEIRDGRITSDQRNEIAA